MSGRPLLGLGGLHGRLVLLLLRGVQEDDGKGEVKQDAQPVNQLLAQRKPAAQQHIF